MNVPKFRLFNFSVFRAIFPEIRNDCPGLPFQIHTKIENCSPLLPKTPLPLPADGF
jgi:hypothetical protein